MHRVTTSLLCTAITKLGPVLLQILDMVDTTNRGLKGPITFAHGAYIKPNMLPAGSASD
jgi:hypothetical protein